MATVKDLAEQAWQERKQHGRGCDRDACGRYTIGEAMEFTAGFQAGYLQAQQDLAAVP